MFDKVLNAHLQIKSLNLIQRVKTWRLWKISSIYLFDNDLFVDWSIRCCFFVLTPVMISKNNYFCMCLYF